MRYKFNTDQLINRLVPHFLSGRNYILFLQSLVYPLQTINNQFSQFAKKKEMEARMTSQVLYFEWFLNQKFRQYFTDQEETIYIKESQTIGVDIYFSYSDVKKPFTLWHENELITSIRPEDQPRELYYLKEEKSINKVSFMVCAPEVTISEKEFVYMLTHIVNIYRLAGKTYLIKLNSKEINPNL